MHIRAFPSFFKSRISLIYIKDIIFICFLSLLFCCRCCRCCFKLLAVQVIFLQAPPPLLNMSANCFWILTTWYLLGSVLWLLQLRWPKQSPPCDQCHWWDWTVVAEPSSLQGDCLQWGECYPGPWTGEIIIIYTTHEQMSPGWYQLCE